MLKNQAKNRVRCKKLVDCMKIYFESTFEILSRLIEILKISVLEQLAWCVI